MITKLINLMRKQKDKRILVKNKKRFPNSVVSASVVFDNKTILEGENVINDNTNISSSKIGACSVIGSRNDLRNCSIGRFCSLSSGIIIQPWTHPTTFVSSYPGFFKTGNNYPFGKGDSDFKECLCCDSGYYIEIGNDVWIGHHVILKGGIKIGDGAIIGMGAVVTKDVPPYSVVGGVPAKIIKLRFEEKQIKQLLNIKWWNWPIDLIKQRRNMFVDIDNFLSRFGDETEQ